jgi:hypothetical protein
VKHVHVTIPGTFFIVTATLVVTGSMSRRQDNHQYYSSIYPPYARPRFLDISTVRSHTTGHPPPISPAQPPLRPAIPYNKPNNRIHRTYRYRTYLSPRNVVANTSLSSDQFALGRVTPIIGPQHTRNPKTAKRGGSATTPAARHVMQHPTTKTPPPQPQRPTTMRDLAPTTTAAALLLLLCGIASADDIVTKNRIKVQLFAGPAFVSEVSVDAYHNQCLSLDNNLYVLPHMRAARAC